MAELAAAEERRVHEVIAEVADVLDAGGIPYLLMGGIASALLGRPRWTRDVDLFVRPADAGPALDALAAAGFWTEETNPSWIYKAEKASVAIDLMFKVYGDIYVDEEMLERAVERELAGKTVRVVAPEDLIVMKAASHDEPSARHWHDALAVIADCELDWDYVVRRAQHGARRVLSLLVYAQSNDLVVPERPIRELFSAIYDGG